MDLGGGSRDSTGFDAIEEGLILTCGRNLMFLSCSDLGLGVCRPFQTGSHVSTCVDAWNSAYLSSCQRGFRHPGENN